MATLEELEAQAGIVPPQAPSPVQQRVVGPPPQARPGVPPVGQRPGVPPPVARGTTQVQPVPTPDDSPYESLGSQKKGFHYDPSTGTYINNRTGLPLSKQQMQALGLTVPGSGGGGGTTTGTVAANLYPDMKPWVEYTLPSGTKVIPVPKMTKYGLQYDLQITDKDKIVGPGKPGDTRTRVVDGKKIAETVNEKGIWVADPAHAQPPPGVYPPNSEHWLRGKLWRANKDGMLEAAPAHMQPPPGKFEPNEEVIRGGKLWIANKDGMLEPAPPHMQPSVKSGVRPGGPPIDPEVARAEEKEYRTARAKADAEFMAKRREERHAEDQRRVQVDYLSGLLESNMTATGPTSKWWLPAAQALESAGLLGKETADKVTGTRVFQAISTQLQQQMRMAGTGAVSDKDMVLFGRMIPTAEDSPEANRKMIAAMKQIDNYNRRVWEARETYYDENKNLQGWEKFRKSQTELASPFRRVKSGTADWDALEEGELYVDTDAKGKEQFYFKRSLPQ